jgi:chorismate synthase
MTGSMPTSRTRMMGINAVKGVEIGAGFAVVAQKGSEHRRRTVSARASCVEPCRWHPGRHFHRSGHGGRMAIKPTSSLRLPRAFINVRGEPVEVVTEGRHDPCVGIRATPIAEAMLAIVLMDHVLRHRAQNADVVCATPIIPGRISGNIAD